ncbi:MAG: hypothetical protein JJ938_17785 [Roseicyclus sp.]|nr:hypothetical protein [Roseicyclus sp.]
MVSNGYYLAPCAALFYALAAPLIAETVDCANTQVRVENAGSDAALICGLVAEATDQLASCALTVPEPLTISIVPELEEYCLGIYHCGEGLIEILPRDAYSGRLRPEEAGAFHGVSTDAFYASILRHELAHAALDSMPCPFGTCLVGQEYVAYTMQVRFLPEADRAIFEAAALQDGPISRDALNPIILMMAPDVFARRAWQHLTERNDPCALIGQIARAEVLLDYEHP